jgi:hypothetical protein
MKSHRKIRCLHCQTEYDVGGPFCSPKCRQLHWIDTEALITAFICVTLIGAFMVLAYYELFH